MGGCELYLLIGFCAGAVFTLILVAVTFSVVRKTSAPSAAATYLEEKSIRSIGSDFEILE